MKRKIKPVDLNDFLEADDINSTSIKGEMRKLWPAIHQKLTTGGWAARDVVKWFSDQGVSMTVELFRVYLNELDRENNYQRSTNTFLNAHSVTMPRINKEIQRQSKSTPAPSPKPTTQTTQIGVSKIKFQNPEKQNESAAKSGANPLHALTDRMAAGVPHTKFETD
jgi:hypothetical protein